MDFNESQKKAIETINGNVVITAVAGSGKTSVLVNRIVNMVENYDVKPQNILAITFSKKAKENMYNKLNELASFADNVNIETFHSLALKIIQSKYDGLFKIWTTQWEKEKCIGEICEKLGLCKKDDVPYNELMIFITKQKVNMIKPDGELIYFDSMPFIADNMKQLYIDYEKYKEENNLIEFDDFLNMACDIFHEDKLLLSQYQYKFKYILSDEYQDVSLNQGLLIEYLGKSNNNTFVVGDVLQAIYAFRGGTSKYLLDFDTEWKDVKTINLSKNYRCSADIVDVVNMFAKSIPESKHRNYAKSISDKGHYKKPEFVEFEDPFDEGEGIADKIISLCKNGYEFKDFAILARTNGQLQKIETTLHDKNISFGIVDGKLFTELPEIQLLLSYLRLAIDENDNDAFRYMYNKPLRWLNKKFLEEVERKTSIRDKSLYRGMFDIDRRNWRFKSGIDEIHDVINSLQHKRYKNVGEMIKYLRRVMDVDSFVSKGNVGDDGLSEQIDNMDSFQDICKKFITIKDLLAYINELNKTMDVNDNYKVKLMTIHKSKGLEFPVVFIIGCSQGLLPHYRTNDINDEKRLMYVAITRAEKELYLSSVEVYNDRLLGTSEFIDDLKDTIVRIGNDKKRYKQII